MPRKKKESQDDISQYIVSSKQIGSSDEMAEEAPKKKRTRKTNKVETLIGASGADGEKYVTKSVDVVIHDCNYEDGKETQSLLFKHSSPSLIHKKLNNLGIKTIILVHNQPRQMPTCLLELEKSDYAFIDSFDGFIFYPSLLNYLEEFNDRMKEIMKKVFP